MDRTPAAGGSSTAGAIPQPLRYQHTPPGQSDERTAYLHAQELSDEPHAQYATYPAKEVPAPYLSSPPGGAHKDGLWIPLPMKPWFWIPLSVIMILGAITLEVVFFVGNKRRGFPSGNSDRSQQVLHYVYTLPPVIIAGALAAMWAWTDAEIKKMQPYIDLSHGDALPQRSLLLDYTRYNNFIVWTRAVANKHYLVAITAIMLLLTMSFQPLASALLIVRDVWWTEPLIPMQSQHTISLAQDLQNNDLTSFLAASGYAGASVQYKVEPPPFTRAPWTVSAFTLPIFFTNNGTAIANTTAVRIDPGCEPVTVTMSPLDNRGWQNSVTHNGCTVSWTVRPNSRTLFGTDTPTCTPAQLPEISPIIFWFFTYQPRAMASAAFCTPKLSIHRVTAAADIATGNLTRVTLLEDITSSPEYASISGPPLNGRPYNGMRFPLADPDPFVLARENATRLQLPAAILMAAQLQTENDYFANNKFWEVSQEVYGAYLSLVARDMYFSINPGQVLVEIRTFRKRVFLSGLATHLLAAGLFVVGLCCIGIQLFHRLDREGLSLKHEPGTIASAVSIGGNTGVGAVLSGRQDEQEIKDALKDKKFKMDPVTNKLVMEGEPEYEAPGTPMVNKRRSVNMKELLQGRRMSTLTPMPEGYSAINRASPGPEGNFSSKPSTPNLKHQPSKF